MPRNRTNGQRAFLLWRPVLLFGGGLGLAIFEAVQPLFGHEPEWAIVSLAATMMGLEAFARGPEPENHSPGRSNHDRRERKGNPEEPGNPGSRGSPGALTVWVAPAGPAAAAG